MLLYRCICYTFVVTLGMNLMYHIECLEAEFQLLLASKTPYTIREVDLDLQFEGCDVHQLNALIRHGSRNPKRKDVTITQSFIEKVKTVSSKPLHESIKNWTPKFNLDQEKDLSPAGRVELKSLATNYMKLFKTLLSHNKNKHLFVSSSTNRTVTSCVSFQNGLKTSNTEEFDFQDLQKNCLIHDELIRFFDVCQKYLSDVSDNDFAMKEVDEFENGKEVQGIINKIKKLLKLNDNFPITYSELKSIYNVIGTEVSNHGSSELVELFSLEDFKVLEYGTDIKSYWKKSYGHKINYEQSCPLLKDIFSHMHAAITKERYYKATFRFGHSETLLPLLALMGLFNDSIPLRANNYHQHSNRQFRTSKIGQFAANLAIVLYRCDSDLTFSKYDYYLIMLHNEQPIYFPCCPDTLLCSYYIVRDYYQEILDKCDFHAICDMKEVNEMLDNSRNEL